MSGVPNRTSFELHLSADASGRLHRSGPRAPWTPPYGTLSLQPGHRRLASERAGAPALRAALIAWLEASSGDSEITVAGRSKPTSAWANGSARSVPWP